jgi:hypothetical protein
MTTLRIAPFFLGPRQIIASSGELRRNPTDITAKLSSTKTGSHPLPLACTFSPSSPTIFGIEGPHISISRSPTYCIPLSKEENRK